MKKKNLPENSEIRWKKLIEHLPVMVFESNLNNELTYTSNSVFQILGYPPDALKGKNAVLLFHPDDRQRLLENIRKKLEDTLYEAAKYRIRRKDGKYITATFGSAPILQQGKPIGLMGVAIDISASEKLEKELLESEERYRSLFVNAPLGIYRTTSDGEIVVANEALIKMMGFDSLEELKQVNSEEHNHKTGFARDTFKEKPEKEGQITRWESLWTRKDGSQIWVRGNAILIKDKKEGKVYYDGVVEDISYRKKTESLLKRQQDMLNISQQMAHMGSWEEDMVTGTVMWSKEEYKIFELPESTPISEELFFSYVHPDDRHLLQKRMELLSCQEREIEIVYRLVVNNRQKWIRSIMTSHCNQDGNATRLYGMDMDITTEKKQQLHLEKESQLLKKTQELGRIGSWELYVKTKEVKASEVLIELYGLPRKEKYTLTDFTQRIHPEDIEYRGMAKDNWSILKQVSYHSTYRLLVNGKVIWINAVGEVIFDNQGNPETVIAAVQDITWQKNKEFALKRMEQEKEAIIRAIPDMIFVFDRAGVYCDFIPGIDSITLIPPEKFLGKKILDVLPREIANRHFESLQKAFDTGQVQVSEYILTNTDGTLKFFEARFSPVHQDRAVVIVRDVTQKKKAEESIQRLVAIVDSSDAIIISKMLDGVISSWNRGAERVYGYKANEVVGLSINIIVPSDLKKELKTFTKRIMAGKRVENFETHRICKNGSMVEVSLSLSEIKNEKGEITGIAVVGQDITRQKQLERELIAEKEVAERATRTKSLFLANMSHEIRTPLNAILGFSEIISKRIDDPVLKEYVDSMYSSGKALLNLINDLLDLSKAEAGKMVFYRQSVDVRYLAHNIESIFRMKARQKELDFRINIAPDVPSNLFLDELKIRQVLLNLTSNAIKFTERGGIKINIKADAVSPKGIDLVIEVRDTGKGIPAKFHKKIFNLFEQQDTAISKHYGGTGLGLAITHQIVSQMGGHIDVESQEGKGSLFRVFLPGISVSDTQASQKHPKNETDDIRFASASLLIVDDTYNNRLVLKAIFEEYPFRVFEAENGVEALKCMQQNKIDLIFMDIRMPVMNGMEAIEHIREHPDWKNIPVVALTASATEFEEKKFARKGFDNYLRKPATINEIITVLRQYLPFDILAPKPEKVTTLSKGTQRHFAKIEQRLLKEAMPLQKKLMGLRPRQKVKKLALILLDIGKEYKSEELLRYGEKLLLANKNFLLEKEKHFIDNLPNFVDHLKKSYNGHTNQ